MIPTFNEARLQDIFHLKKLPLHSGQYKNAKLRQLDDNSTHYTEPNNNFVTMSITFQTVLLSILCT